MTVDPSQDGFLLRNFLLLPRTLLLERVEQLVILPIAKSDTLDVVWVNPIRFKIP
jgi:hypothetical protein